MSTRIPSYEPQASARSQLEMVHYLPVTSVGRRIVDDCRIIQIPRIVYPCRRLACVAFPCEVRPDVDYGAVVLTESLVSHLVAHVHKKMAVLRLSRQLRPRQNTYPSTCVGAFVDTRDGGIAPYSIATCNVVCQSNSPGFVTETCVGSSC